MCAAKVRKELQQMTERENCKDLIQVWLLLQTLKKYLFYSTKVSDGKESQAREAEIMSTIVALMVQLAHIRKLN